MSNIVFNELPVNWDNVYGGNGYFAGTADGIVTIAGAPAAREIYCFNAKTLELVRITWSFDNGHYIVPNLSTDYQYLLLCRDHKNEYAPIGWDWRTPATEMTYQQQMAKVEEWRNV